jgi:hypothetical protein
MLKSVVNAGSWVLGINNVAAIKDVASDDYSFDDSKLKKVHQIGTELLHMGAKYATWHYGATNLLSMSSLSTLVSWSAPSVALVSTLNALRKLGSSIHHARDTLKYSEHRESLEHILNAATTLPVFLALYNGSTECAVAGALFMALNQIKNGRTLAKIAFLVGGIALLQPSILSYTTAGIGYGFESFGSMLKPSETPPGLDDVSTEVLRDISAAVLGNVNSTVNSDHLNIIKAYI